MSLSSFLIAKTFPWACDELAKAPIEYSMDKGENVVCKTIQCKDKFEADLLISLFPFSRSFSAEVTSETGEALGKVSTLENRLIYEVRGHDDATGKRLLLEGISILGYFASAEQERVDAGKRRMEELKKELIFEEFNKLESMEFTNYPELKKIVIKPCNIMQENYFIRTMME